LLLLAALAAPAAAQTRAPEVVVTATRLPQPAEQVASSVTVITAEDLARKQRRTLADALGDVPGLYIARSGGQGKSSRVFLRGAESRHVLVLIDGVEINDPSSPDGAFEFQHLLTDDIERIEILRGPQGMLYGSDAIGGVVNILTKKGKGGIEARGSLEGGSYGTFNQTAGLSGASNMFDYSLNAAHFRDVGISVTPDRLRPPAADAERDGYDNATFSTRLGVSPLDNFSLGVSARYSRTASKLDVNLEDPNSEEHTRQFFGRTEASLDLFDGQFAQKLGFGYTDYRRRDDDPPDPLSFGAIFSEARFDARKTKIDWQGDIHLFPGQTLTLGAETEKEEADTAATFCFFCPPSFTTMTKADVRSTAGYAQLSSAFFDSLYWSLGVRHDAHERFGGATTWRAAPAYLIRASNTKLKAAYGTGFRAPTLFQLFGASFFGGFGVFMGNPDLKPEDSKGWEAGFEQAIFGERVKFGSVYFQSTIENLIVFNDTFTSLINRPKAEIEGVESFLELEALQGLTVQADHTWTIARDAATGALLLRRPKHKASVNAVWQATDALNFDAGVLYTGRRADVDAVTFATKRLGGYTTVNAAASFALNRNVTAFARVENLLDRDIEDIDGFQRPGLSGILGVRARY
jgi:vitamin B12 transporter